MSERDPGGLAARTPTGTAGRAELVVAGLVTAVGVVVLVDALRIAGPATSNAVGPRFVPVVVGTLLVLVGGWLAVDVLRGRTGEPDAGEDVDLSRPSDWRTIVLLAAAFGGHVLLIRPAGWPVAGAVLFWGTVAALGSRAWLRDGAVSAALAVLVYLVFARGLGVGLPAGPFGGGS
jgi:putative tricarboxylic transport membrane protein